MDVGLTNTDTDTRLLGTGQHSETSICNLCYVIV